MCVCVYSGLEGESAARHSKMAKHRSADDQDDGANEKKSGVIITIITLQNPYCSYYLLRRKHSTNKHF